MTVMHTDFLKSRHDWNFNSMSSRKTYNLTVLFDSMACLLPHILEWLASWSALLLVSFLCRKIFLIREHSLWLTHDQPSQLEKRNGQFHDIILSKVLSQNWRYAPGLVQYYCIWKLEKSQSRREFWVLQALLHEWHRWLAIDCPNFQFPGSNVSRPKRPTMEEGCMWHHAALNLQSFRAWPLRYQRQHSTSCFQRIYRSDCNEAMWVCRILNNNDNFLKNLFARKLCLMAGLTQAIRKTYSCKVWPVPSSSRWWGYSCARHAPPPAQ